MLDEPQIGPRRIFRLFSIARMSMEMTDVAFGLKRRAREAMKKSLNKMCKWSLCPSITDELTPACCSFEDQAGHALEVVPRHNDSAVDMDVSLESQYADDYHIPPTPGLAMSPITPKTPSSQFPHTPTSMAGDFAAVQSSEFPTDEQSMYIPEGIHTEKELDPTTLFVGGLEMHGLGAWDEEKVKNFFAQYDGLESIKLVRPGTCCSAALRNPSSFFPANGKAAFAFVKFNNTESPAHAVAEVVRWFLALI